MDDLNAYLDLGNLVEKKVFRTKNFSLISGKMVREVQIGYEMFGRLNMAGDNAVFICHPLAGTSHCAGKYSTEDTKLGYWDQYIGPDKLFDTNSLFVISADGLCNAQAKNPMVYTTGPSSTDPETGRPYGLSFPQVTCADQVNIHKALLDSLGVKKLKLVTGFSLGSNETIQWGAQFPGFVERLIPVCGFGLRTKPLYVNLLQISIECVKMDPFWNEGNYCGGTEPLSGITFACRNMAAAWFGSFSPEWERLNGQRNWAVDNSDPLDSPEHHFACQNYLNYAKKTIPLLDANSLIYLLRSCQLFGLNERTYNVASICAPILFITEESDMIGNTGAYITETVRELTANGIPADVFDLKCGMGHLAGLTELAKANQIIRQFIKSEILYSGVA